MNNSPSIALESALIAYLTPLCPFAESVTGASNRLHEDEDNLGPLGQFIALPAVIVMVGELPSLVDSVPLYGGTATITIRHSTEQSTVATHRTDAITAADSLWDIGDLFEAIDTADGLTLSGLNHTGETFTRDGRKLETAITFDVQISSKETTP